MVMDMLRSCYSTKMKFFKDSDLEIPVRWYFCDDAAQAFPAHHLFASANWDSLPGGTNHVGEVVGAPRPYNDGLMPRFLEQAGDHGNNPCSRAGIVDASQDPQTGIITLTTENPHLFRLGQRVYMPIGIPFWQIHGPFTLVGIPSQSQVQIFWPREMQDFPGGDQYLWPIAIWGQFSGLSFVGSLADFANGCTFDAAADSHTNEDGLCYACMPLEPTCWLTITGITNPAGIGSFVGQVIQFDLWPQPNVDIYLVLLWQTEVTFSASIYTWSPFFTDGLNLEEPRGNGLGLNAGMTLPFSESDDQTPDWFSLDQQTFWWLAYNPVAPAGEPFVRDERWSCILTFYNPLEVIPGPPFELFPVNFVSPDYWPSAFGL
jgi:hypothetical protein